MNAMQSISLERYLRSQATRWALLGFVVTLLLAVPCILYSAKVASERQLLVAAKSATRAFRPMILQDNVRDAEFQIRKALELKADESVVVRGPDLSAVYPIEESDKISRCYAPNGFCWAPRFQSVSLLYPIYFDSQKPDVLYGYLELTMKPTLDWSVLSILVVLLLVAFIGQAFGLSSALTQSARQVVAQLSQWSDHLRRSPELRPTQSSPAPYTELKAMQAAVDGLYIEIASLRDQTAQEARSEAQFSLLREISHDLKTPHSLLAKYLALHLDTVRTTGKIDPTEVVKIEVTLKRMGELIRQIRVVPLGQSMAPLGQTPHACDLIAETKSIAEDLKNDPEAIARGVKIDCQIKATTLGKARISTLGLYRILENLTRNAVEAVAPGSGRVTVAVESINGNPAIVVSDNGSGIAPEIRDKVLAFDFTTKPARGTGLGLGIVDKICKEFDADLHFDSVVGQGTTFSVVFKSGEAVYGEV